MRGLIALALAACTSADARPAPGGHAPGYWCHCPDVPVGAPDVLLIVGHSLVAGNGDDAQYSGRRLPPGVTVRSQGSTLTTWAAAPSIVPYVVDHLPAGATVVQRGVGGSSVDDWTATHWATAAADVTTAGAGDPDAVVVWLGENDVSTAGEVATFATQYPALLSTIEAAYPAAHLYLVQVAAADTLTAYVDDVRALQAAEAGAGRTVLDPRTASPDLQVDGVHLTGGVDGGSDDVAHLIVDAW